MRNNVNTQRYIVVLVLFLSAVASPVSACSCSSPARYFDYLKSSSIILKVAIDKVDHNITDRDGDRFLVSNYEYTLIDNISGSDLPKHTPFVQYEFLQIKDISYGCFCGDYTRGGYNLVDRLEKDYEYVVFAFYREKTGELVLDSAISVSGNHVLGDFGQIASWENYQELKTELTRNDQEVYEPQKPVKDTERTTLYAFILFFALVLFGIRYLISRILRDGFLEKWRL